MSDNPQAGDIFGRLLTLVDCARNRVIARSVRSGETTSHSLGPRVDILNIRMPLECDHGERCSVREENYLAIGECKLRDVCHLIYSLSCGLTSASTCFNASVALRIASLSDREPCSVTVITLGL